MVFDLFFYCVTVKTIYNLPVLCHVSHTVRLGYLCTDLKSFSSSKGKKLKVKVKDTRVGRDGLILLTKAWSLLAMQA